MAQVLVRDLNKGVVDRLKAQAKENERSLQAELKLILERAVRRDAVAARKLAAQLRKQLAKGSRIHSDSARLLAEDRSR